MRWKVMVAVLPSVGMAVCQDRPAANSSLRRESPWGELTAINDAAMILLFVAETGAYFHQATGSKREEDRRSGFRRPHFF